MGWQRAAVNGARAAIPAALVPHAAHWRARRRWRDSTVRAEQQLHMRYLLGATSRAAEADSLARPCLEHYMWTTEARWHPQLLVRQSVEGIAALTTHRDPDRAVVLSFMHHGDFTGLPGSLANAGAPCTTVAAKELLTADASAPVKQHIAVVALGGAVVSNDGGFAALRAQLRPGVNLLVAWDMPGTTPMPFLGRTRIGSAAAARLAQQTNSPVVAVTSRPGGTGPTLTVGAPIEPADFATPEHLMRELVRQHEPAVLAWPEALEIPLQRWGLVNQDRRELGVEPAPAVAAGRSARLGDVARVVTH